MTQIPFRQLGQLGVNADTDPFAFTDPRQWTTALNCRFRDGSIWRGPRFRQTGTATGVDPRIVVGYGLNSGGYEFLLPTTNGSVFRWNQHGTDGGEGVQRNLTPDYWLGHDYDEPYTWCEENSVIYVNRPDRELWYMVKGGKVFAKVPGWGEYWRCKAIRALQGQVVAIGVQKDGRDYPTMILTSDYTVYDNPANVWTADTTNSASSNVLAEMPSQLIDGCVMAERMFLYGATATWVMEPTYDQFVYRYRSVFANNAGVISQNCVASVGGSHFVFGPTSIWTHNGQTMQDIADGVVRRKIYDHIVLDAKHLFFAFYNEPRNEISFCYVSNDPDCKFQIPNDPNAPPQACNFAAVFNLKSNTWSFDDLPFVVGAAYVSAKVGPTWAEMGGASWASQGSKTWYAYGDHTPPGPVFVTRGIDLPIVKPLQAVDDLIDLSIGQYLVPNTTTQAPPPIQLL